MTLVRVVFSNRDVCPGIQHENNGFWRLQNSPHFPAAPLRDALKKLFFFPAAALSAIRRGSGSVRISGPTVLLYISYFPLPPWNSQFLLLTAQRGLKILPESTFVLKPFAKNT